MKLLDILDGRVNLPALAGRIFCIGNMQEPMTMLWFGYQISLTRGLKNGELGVLVGESHTRHRTSSDK